MPRCGSPRNVGHAREGMQHPRMSQTTLKYQETTIGLQGRWDMRQRDGGCVGNWGEGEGGGECEYSVLTGESTCS